MSEHEELWTAVTQIVRSQLNEAVWLSTFQNIVPLEESTGTLTIGAPSHHARDKIVARYMPLITEALHELNRPDCRVDVVVNPGESALHSLEPSSEHRIVQQASQVAPFSDARLATRLPGAGGPSASADAGLNPQHTFESFVPGTSNRFALNAALRVAETPGRSYNPLFIYGAAGLGKTHLLHAIGNYVQDNYIHYQLLYVTTETFMNEYVEAIRNDNTFALRRKYREIDVLLMDDIQFMEKKEGLQEEFFHTFNALHGASKQIVISSDRVPDQIRLLQERLLGRMRWGLVTDVQPPDLETRLAILRSKAERDNSNVPPETLDLIASRITSNIRELEGALVRVTAYANLNQVQITNEMAQRLLSDVFRDNQPKIRTDTELLREISEFLGFDVDALIGRSRQRPLVTGRQIAMYVFRELTDLSFPAIARLFGGRDHTTVIHAVDKVQQLMRERRNVYDQVTDLLQRLKTT